MFEPENGMYQFMFANEDDNYYLESLVKVNFQQYLYVKLRQAQYKAVYFGFIQNGKYTLVLPSRESADIYDRTTRKNWQKIFNAPISNLTGKKVEMKDRSEFVRHFVQMLNKNDRLAFVFSMNDFDQLFCSEIDIEQLKKQSRSHLVLIYTSPQAKDSLHYLANKKSIFRSSLFSNIQRMFEIYKNPPIYEKMRENMPEGVIFLNQVDKMNFFHQLGQTQVHNMILYLLLKQSPVLDRYIERVRIYEQVIYLWKYSRKFREDSTKLLGNPLFPENINIKLGKLTEFEKYIDENHLEEMDMLYVQLYCNRGECLQEGSKDYWNDVENTWMFDETSDIWLRKIQMIVSQLHSDQNESKQLEQIISELKRVRAFPLDKEISNKLETLINTLNVAIQNEDNWTFQKGVGALHFAICTWYAKTFDGTEACMDTYEYRCLLRYFDIVGAAENYFEIHESYQNDVFQMRELTQKYIEQKQASKEYADKHPEVQAIEKRIEEGIPVESLEILGMYQVWSNIKERAVDYYNQEVELNKVRARKQEIQTKLLEYIHNLELANNQAMSNNLERMLPRLDEALKDIQKNVVNEQKVLEKVSDLSTHFQTDTKQNNVLHRSRMTAEELEAKEKELIELARRL